MKNELIKISETKAGFPKPTIIIDSQSQPALIGQEVEQRYYRMYLMGGKGDLVMTNYSIDQDYLFYLGNCLKLDLPRFIKIPYLEQGTLSGDILDNNDVIRYINAKVGQGYRVQFFGLTDKEVKLAKELDNPTYVKNLDGVLSLGTKNGFRAFCMKQHIPMPNGAVCNSSAEVMQAMIEINREVVIKASEGTGGAEMGSNISLNITSLSEDDSLQIIASQLEKLNPNQPPYVVEEKIKKAGEASLHIMLAEDGSVVIKPTVFGQLAHDGSYVGGFNPNGFGEDMNSFIYKIANKKIVPALQDQGLTGFHCMDFLYDAQGKIYFIEDNTRPGALDFINHFVDHVMKKNQPGINYAWHHYQVPLAEIIETKTTSFEEIQKALGDLLDPKRDGGFVLVSNPDVLKYGYSLHLTGVGYGENENSVKAEKLHLLAVEKIKQYYGYKIN